jgi:hypothetical protein
VELIRVLNRAWVVEASFGEMARGWRSVEQIAKQLDYPPTHDGIRRAVSQINRIFRQAASQQAPHVKWERLITSKRKIGFRLPLPITFVPPDPWFDPQGHDGPPLRAT